MFPSGNVRPVETPLVGVWPVGVRQHLLLWNKCAIILVSLDVQRVGVSFNAAHQKERENQRWRAAESNPANSVSGSYRI